MVALLGPNGAGKSTTVDMVLGLTTPDTGEVTMQITADLPHAVDNVPVPLRVPFAHVLREGVTNVIRHSGASRCEVRFGETWIEIRDDGRPEDSEPGNGLAGLAERLAPLGGAIDAGPAKGGGFRLRATVPADAT